MFLTRSEYDRGVNTFSPEGRLFQVEYAIEAIKLGSTAIGVQTKQGVILAVEKRLTSPLLARLFLPGKSWNDKEPSSIHKVDEVDVHMGAAMSGLTADARTLIEHGRVESQQHRFTYNEAMPVESCVQALCDLALRFGEDDDDEERGTSMSRPFGVSLLVGGWDAGGKGPVLYETDPSGTFSQHSAKAIGSGSEGAQTALEEGYRPGMTLQEAEVLALETLKQVMEEKVTNTNVDIASIAPEYKLYSETEVAAVIARL